MEISCTTIKQCEIKLEKEVYEIFRLMSHSGTSHSVDYFTEKYNHINVDFKKINIENICEVYIDLVDINKSLGYLFPTQNEILGIFIEIGYEKPNILKIVSK
jgi:NH3-dependent NAD+ synthetase